MGSEGFSFFWDDGDDGVILVRIQLIKYLFIIYKFERFRPIIFISMPHDINKDLNKLKTNIQSINTCKYI